MKKWLLSVFLALFSLSGQPSEKSQTLVKQLDEIRIKTGVHGIAVGIVQGDNPALILTSGFADIETRTPVSDTTQFRFGSVSKTFVALSIMKLVEENALTLDSELRTLIPEIAFTNPYSAQYPMQVIHLLNHTTGWDGMRFAEKAPQPSPPISIKQALDLLPESRTSRWPPGARSAYNNTGPLVAAYLVEKLSGQPFESYVKKHFLQPLDMQNTDYFYTDDYRENGATLYIGERPLTYMHMNNRAAGALNSSIKDMVKFIRFLNQHGAVDDRDLLLPASIQQLQKPRGSLAADAGLEVTHLPGLQQFHANGLVFFGHEGSVRGGSSLLAYQPDLNVGYVIAVNGEGPVVPHIHKFLSDMLSGTNAPAEVEKSEEFNDSHFSLSGWYFNISPISQLLEPFQRLIPWKLDVSAEKAIIRPLIGGPFRTLRAGADGQFLRENTDQVVAVALPDPIAGQVLHYGPQTLKPIISITALLPMIIALTWVLSGFLALIMSVWWLPITLYKKASFGSNEQLRLWPVVTFLFALFNLLLLVSAKNSLHLNSLLGQPSWLSVGVMISTSLFFVSSIYSLFKWWTLTKSVKGGFNYLLSTLVIGLNGIISLYLLSYGLIGLRLWT